MKKTIRKVVLAYSGARHLGDPEDGCRTLRLRGDHLHRDIGQGEELEARAPEGEEDGVNRIFVEDLREEFVRDFVFPMFGRTRSMKASTFSARSIARPLIAKHLVKVARQNGRRRDLARRHGKGNDQVRFELGAYALMRSEDHRAVARVGPALARQAAALRREASHPGGL